MTWSREIEEVASRIASRGRGLRSRKRWFAVHVIFYVEFRKPPQPKKIHAWENIYLVSATNHREAIKKGRDLAGRAVIDDPTFTWNGRAARWRVGGIRKTVECSLCTLGDLTSAEVTYSTIEFDSKAELRRFALGKRAKAVIVD